MSIFRLHTAGLCLVPCAMVVAGGLFTLDTAHGQTVTPYTSHDPRCDAPPYRDTPEAYKVAEPGFRNEAVMISKASGKPVDVVMKTQIPLVLRATCEAKFDGADRTAFYAMDINDQDFEDYSTSRLATQYLGTKIGLDDLKQNARSIVIDDFVLDDPALVDRDAKISISGSYVLEGELEQLYVNSQGVLASRSSRSVGKQQSVPLMTNHAMRSLRQRLLACQSNPTTAQLGCQVTLRGHVIRCTQTNTFGVREELPCLEVWDGD